MKFLASLDYLRAKQGGVLYLLIIHLHVQLIIRSPTLSEPSVHNNCTLSSFMYDLLNIYSNIYQGFENVLLHIFISFRLCIFGDAPKLIDIDNMRRNRYIVYYIWKRRKYGEIKSS